MCAAKIPSVEPNVDHRFRVEADSYGKRLALVFGNHAAGGECPFYTALRCHHCDIGMGEGANFDIDTNRLRLEWYQSHFDDDWASIAHLVIYNSGSVLNPAEMPFDFLHDVLMVARGMTSLKVISLDSRESFVTVERLRQIAELLRNDQCVRIIIGIESANDEIRNNLLRKGMPVSAIQRAFDNIAKVARQFGLHRVGIDVNILVGGPGTTKETAATDAAETARFALQRSQVQVDFNIHPYYTSSQGLQRFPSHLRCPTSSLIDSVQAVADVCKDSSPRSRIFIGIHDEGHDADSISRLEESRRIGPSIQRFNVTQDGSLMRH